MDRTKFDRFADDYNQLHARNIAVSGENTEFFHEYKIKILRCVVQERHMEPARILDFGAGIGNSIPFFRRYFPKTRLVNVDVSRRSLEIARARFPGEAEELEIEGQSIPAEENSFDVCFSACVFHHISHEEHRFWLGELLRVTRPGGMLAIFEHNPRNLLTVRAVNSCPFDSNAELIRAESLISKFGDSGWRNPQVNYHVFFPHALAGLRVFEPYLSGLPFGAQYSVIGEKEGSMRLKNGSRGQGGIVRD